MCGLTGFITKKKTILTRGQIQKRKQAIEALLVANEERGMDSTGIASIKDGKVSLFKQVMPATAFIQQPWAKKILGNSCKVLIGHTRNATQGAKTVANAHPFLIGSALGAHNGNITNFKELENTEVDSQAIFTLLDREKNDYMKVLRQIVGTCTLSWVDLGMDNIFLVSHQNPLAMARVPEIDTVFWSSLKLHLKLTLQALFGSNYEIWDLKKDYVYRVTPKLQIYKEAVEFGTVADTEFSTYLSTDSSKDSSSKDSKDNKRVREGLNMVPFTQGHSLLTAVQKHSERHLSSQIKHQTPSDDIYLEERNQNGRQLSFLHAQLTLKDKAVFEGCDVCSRPIYDKAFYNYQDKGLICLACRKKPEFKGYGNFVNFGDPNS